MSHDFPSLYTSFDGHRRIASGPLEKVALAVKQALETGAVGPVDDTTGRSIDIDTRGADHEMLARLATHPAKADDRAGSAQPGVPS